MRMPAKVLLMRGNRMGGDMERMDGPAEMRRYPRYDDGRFAPRSEYDRNDMYDYPETEVRGNRMIYGRTEMYDRQETEGPRRMRGERMDGGYSIRRDMNANMDRSYPIEIPYSHKDEIGFRSGKKERGHASGEMGMDEETALEWIGKMKHADGTSGMKWTYERAEQLMKQVGYQGEPMEFFAILNAMYSDYCKAAKKFGVDRPDFYAELAKAWLEDKDAEDGKAMLYYECIVKK